MAGEELNKVKLFTKYTWYVTLNGAPRKLYTKFCEYVHNKVVNALAKDIAVKRVEQDNTRSFISFQDDKKRKEENYKKCVDNRQMIVHKLNQFFNYCYDVLFEGHENDLASLKADRERAMFYTIIFTQCKDEM